MTGARSRLLVCALILPIVVGCPSTESIAPAHVTDLAGASPEVAALINGLVEQANERPSEAAARAALAMAYDINGLTRAAIQSYGQAVTLDPDEPRYRYLRALSQAAIGDLEAALISLDEVRELDGSYVPALLHRGQWLLDLGRVDSAGEAYRQAADLEPDNLPAWIGQARVHLKRQESVQAVRILENILGRSRHAYVYQMLGLAYRQQGDLERATKAFARGKPGSRPGWPDPWREARNAYMAGFGAELQKAEILMERGKPAEALAILEALRPGHATDLTLLNNLSVAYRQAGQPDRAFQVLLDGLEMHPGYYPFHLNIAEGYFQKGQIDRALSHLDQAIEVNPTLAHSHVQKGTYLMRAKRYEESLAALEQALSFDAGNARIFMTAGIVAAEIRAWPTAVERLEQAIALDPSQVMAYIGLGKVRAEQGNFDAAEAALQEAEKLSPNHPRLGQVRQRLARLRAGDR